MSESRVNERPPRHSGPFRLVALFEGATLLGLVFIGMPLKYGFGIGGFNSVLGPIHGVVFLAYVAFVFYEMIVARHSFEWLVEAMLASIIPGGTFWLFGKSAPAEGDPA